MLFMFFFSFVDWKYPIYQSRLDVVGNLQIVTKDVFNQAINKVKDECEGATWGLIVELEHCFHHDELMKKFGVIYWNYGLLTQWKQKTCFTLTWLCWKPCFVCLGRWVKVGSIFLNWFLVKPLICKLFFSRWPCYINLKQFCKKIMSWILSLGFSARFSPLPFSTISFQNLSN